jgi:hypothetical protein
MSEAESVTQAVARQVPLQALPHEFESYRDIPESCTCEWIWRVQRHRFELFTFKKGCPWHGR